MARLLFDSDDRTWAALVLPALAVAVALTSTRSAWVGVCAAAALLFALKDFRLFAVLPVVHRRNPQQPTRLIGILHPSRQAS